MALNLFQIYRLRITFLEAFKNKSFQDAIDIGEEMLQLYNDAGVTSGERYIDDISNLASVYFEDEEYVESLSLYTKALDVANKTEKNSLKPADLLNSIAICYNLTSNYKQAEENFKKSIEIYEDFINKEIIKKNYTSYINTLYNTGNNYYDAHKYKKAAEYLNASISLREQKDTDYIDNLNSLGYVYEDTSKNRKAADCFENALVLIKDIFGTKSYEYVSNLYYIATFYHNYQKFNPAVKKYNELIHTLKENLGDKNIYYAEAINNFAALMFDAKDYDKALSLNLKSINIVKDLFGENDIYYINHARLTGLIYTQMGDYKKAEDKYISMLSILKSSIGTDNINYISISILLSRIYRLQNQNQKAIDFLNSLLLNISQESILYDKCLLELAANYIIQNDMDNLYSIYEKIQEVFPSLSFEKMIELADED